MQKRTVLPALAILLFAIAIVLDSGLLFMASIVFAIVAGGGSLYYWRMTAPYRAAHEELERTKKRDTEIEKIQPPIAQAQHKTAPRSYPPVHRKYKPGPVRHLTPAPRQHHNVDALRAEHNALSGEEVFRRLKRHNIKHKIRRAQSL